MKTLQKCWDWLVWSSANPNELSLTVKGALTGVITLTTVGLGIANIHIPANVPVLLNQIVDGSIVVMQAIAGLVSALAIVGGLIRKVYLTIRGENLAIQ